MSNDLDSAVELITSKIKDATNIAWSLKIAGRTMKPDELERVHSRLYDDLNAVAQAFEALNAITEVEA